MKDTLYHSKALHPGDFPFDIPLHTADGKIMIATIEDVGHCFELWLHIGSTDERAKILEFTSALAAGVVLGEIERKFESVFAHVVHHRLTIPYIPGKDIYHGIPPFP
jgi:hypothetical protein